MIPRGLYRDALGDSSTVEPKYAEYRDGDGNIDPYFDEEDDDEEWPNVNLGGFPTGIDLIGTCLRVVWKDKEILAYQAISIFLCFDALIIFLYAIFGGFENVAIENDADMTIVIIKLFPFYIVAAFIGTFFSAATVAVATIRMKGGNPTFPDGLEAASRKIPSILGWAVIVAVVGMVLSLLRSRRRGSRLAADIAQLAWGIATYFVVPVILFENVGPLEAIDRSRRIVWRTWKESLAGNFGMSLVFFALILLGLLAFYPIGYAVSGLVGGIIAVVIWFMVVSVFSSAANGVLVAALYRLARTGKLPADMEGYREIGGAVKSVEVYRDVADLGLTADQLTEKYAR